MNIAFFPHTLQLAKNTLKISAIAMALASLFACEDSESPSSGSKDFSEVAGTYTGSVDVTGSAPNFDYEYTLSDEPINIVVANDGKVTVKFLGQNESRYINARTINVTFDLDESYQNYSCAGTIAVNGQFTADNRRILGAVSGNGTCSDGETTSPVVIDGRLEAQR